MSDDIRAVPGGYGPRYSPFSTYAPQPQPGPGRSSAIDDSPLPSDWDPYVVLRRYREAAAAAGAGWAIDSNDHTEEAS